MSKEYIKNTKVLNRLIPYLLLNYCTLSNPGLLNGTMGGVVFFSHYAKYSNNNDYLDFAEKLVDFSFSNVHSELTIDFKTGLCGIGWGIEYILQNKLMEGDSDEILEVIDRKIMEYDFERLIMANKYEKVKSILSYISIRLKSPRKNSDAFSLDTKYQNNIIDIIKSSSYIENDFSLSAITKNILCPNYTPPSISHDWFGELPNIKDLFSKIENIPLGIKGGLTGLGLKIILS